MKLRFFILYISIVIISCKNEIKNTPVEIDPAIELKNRVDEYFTALQSIGKYNGVVYVSKNNKDIIHKAYNLQVDQKSSTFVSPSSEFDIHSVSKLMAHYLIEKYELEGKLKKSQPLNDFVNDFPRGEEITISMLLNHSSGLPRSLANVEEDKLKLSPEQILDYSKKQTLLFEPGTDVQYSNVGYELVYFIIEEVSKNSFSQCLVNEVFIPLDMKHSGAHFYATNNKPTDLAKNHEKKGDSIVQVANILPDELRTSRIFSTATDLNKFLNHINKEPYASLLKDKNNVIEKSGGSDGIRVEIYTNLDYEYNYVLLANYDEIPFQKTVADFANILEDKPYEIPKEINRSEIILPIEILKRYEGTYSFADLGSLELVIKVQDGKLVVIQDGEQVGILLAESESVFFENPKEAESFEFIASENDTYTALMGFKGVKLKGILVNK